MTLHCKNDTKNGKKLFESKIIKYFTFDNSISVGLRNGDILILNPTVPHCVSTKTDDYKHSEVFCVLHYFKSLLCGRNNNDIEFKYKIP